jgi:spermidine synthase
MPRSFTMANWHEELICESFGYRICANKTLVEQRSAYQSIQVVDMPLFGRVLVLDGSFQCSEGDEFLYHEPLVHGALFGALSPKEVLIIGGGDGGAAEEALKHASVQQLIHVEIDAEVLQVCSRWLSSIHGGVLNGSDRRYRSIVADGWKFLETTRLFFDAIVLDLTDPGDASEALYSESFYALAASRLRPGGAMSLHIGSPFAQRDRCREVLHRLRRQFAFVKPILVTIPMSGGPWVMAICTNKPALALNETRIQASLLKHDLRWLTPSTWDSAQVVPPYMADSLLSA